MNERKLTARLKAKTLREVLFEHGYIDKKAAHEKLYPDQSAKSHQQGAERDFRDPQIWEELAQMLQVDDETVANLNNGELVRMILEDLKRLNVFLESGQTDVEDTVKLSTAKDAKYKILHALLEKRVPEAETPESVDDVIKRIQERSK